MASLVERLRDRSDRRPLYNLDDSDDDVEFVLEKKPGPSSSRSRIQKIEQEDDEIERSCEACGKNDNLISCDTCTCCYHRNCLMPPLRGPLPKSWKCPQCVGPLTEIDKILDCEKRPISADYSDASEQELDQVPVKHYLVKWKGLSYLHCTWVPEMEFTKAYRSNPRLRTRVNHFHKQASSASNTEDEFVPIRAEWTTVDRIIACRGVDEDKQYLVKWKELPYDECYWEMESDIASFHEEIERFNRRSRRKKVSVTKKRSSANNDMESKKKQKEFERYDSSPSFLAGGSLHPYQLEGLNFLRFSWSNQTHVILADEMGLGKTIQSIAFLASLFEENVAPHLVVAPLSTLRNWEREFALWAPQMNVVMYVGSAQARSVIREYEFYYPKSMKKSNKKKKAGHAVTESRHDRIKFDVLLTSYEMINLDTSSLKPIKWESMIVDEGHRLKNKDSKLFSMLTQYPSRHRVLLTGTPLQNNLDELFMLMHFLDAKKFGSLEEFQDEFKDINQEEQVSRLHKMLAPHLLRRVKKDVMKELPPKRELILRVELSSKQKEYYKAILTRNYEILTRKGGAQISLINVVMELRKLCCHPFMLEGVEPDDTDEFNKQLFEFSGKIQLLDKMMVKLKEQGHRVLIYSQFQHMLDLLEDCCTSRKWLYERIDGKVGGAERQIRIDRFNAKNSSRFCFLLSTRAGGLGINLATADTVVIYDSDWNPHADLQAMARAHRLGQTNKVMIYRFVTRGTIEEKMMQMTKKKMVLEHLVVGKLKTQNINQEELDDIIRYGAQDLFADDNDELVKSRQIHYDDAAIDRLLNREQMGDEDATLTNEEEDGFLKAFKVANFEYVDEAEIAAEEEPAEVPMQSKVSANNSERENYWEDLLRDKYEVHKIEEFNAMGKGKRSRKQMAPVEEDDFAGVEDISSDGEDDSYEADLTDSETASPGAATQKKPNKRRARDVSKIPLMEGEDKSLRVLGFNRRERTEFLKILMRFGTGNYDWEDFIPCMRQKTREEIHNYGKLVLEHLMEPEDNSPTFKDGVPKEGVRVPEVLVRITQMTNIREKVQASSNGSVHFSDDILALHPHLRVGKCWKENHDFILLQAVLKHGYGKWQAIAEDKDLGIQDVICQQLIIPVPGTFQPHSAGVGTSQVPFHYPGAGQVQASTSGIPRVDGVNLGNIDVPADQAKRTNGDNDVGTEGVHAVTDTAARAQFAQGQSLFSYREVQRRISEFIKKRVMLMEKGLNCEMAKTFYPDYGTYNMPSAEMGQKVEDASPIPEGSYAQFISVLPGAETISSTEISAYSSDQNPDRLKAATLYNEMNKLVTDSAQDSLDACFGSLASTDPRMKLRNNLAPLEVMGQEMNQILSMGQHSSPFTGVPASTEGAKGEVENLGSSANLGAQNSAFGASAGTDNESSAMDIDSNVERNPTEVK